MVEPGTPGTKRSWGDLARLAAKALLLAALINVAFVPMRSLDTFGSISLYNRIVPGRLRLPYGDDPARSYNVSVTNLEALFASHELDVPSPSDDDLQALVVGDSSVWGFRLSASDTLAAQLNRLQLLSRESQIEFHNLGYPTMSLLKDLMILERGLAYQPDVIIWLVTLESFPVSRQAESPIVSLNRAESEALLIRFGIAPDRYLPAADSPSWWKTGVIGRRQELAELFRLQMYGLMWAASGVDHDLSTEFELRAEDLEADNTFQGFPRDGMQPDDLAWDLLASGVDAAAPVPVLIVNEPIFISAGANSEIRYNFFYPRWAYDAYREWLATECRDHGWVCVDLWEALPAATFTDSAVHYNARGAELLASRLSDPILAAADSSR
ncbi:MAG TPA: SGNH/GDSL hydrolase family protein [Anaerolineales bacterium]|nr:SGNH/GDSL hydrolase family protein [Anaerolineales bacterium]